jgi:hypothetical protein
LFHGVAISDRNGFRLEYFIKFHFYFFIFNGIT